ncbi:MAG TPA: hypothetical protein PKK06_05065 [Phycisphaerae bacterium]|nr:hypothetical protein [Phycisphaerae bacterium]
MAAKKYQKRSNGNGEKLRERIREIIDAEVKACPISDEQLGAILGISASLALYYRDTAGIRSARTRRVPIDYVAQYKGENNNA